VYFLETQKVNEAVGESLQFLQKHKDEYAASTHSARQTDRQMREEGEIVGAKRLESLFPRKQIQCHQIFPTKFLSLLMGGRRVIQRG
jgi:hypothetical protein